jgi:phosphate transport system ATP-binding protein
MLARLRRAFFHDTPAPSVPEEAGPPTLSIERLTIRYGDRIAIQDARLTAHPGEILALVGPSGCGKSSLLASINRMTDLIPQCRVQGEIRLDGRNILAQDCNVSVLRRQVGMVFQQPNPFPLSIRDNITFPLKEHSIRSKSEREARMEQVLKDTGLWEEVRDRLDSSALKLSGGQQQRLCIARALALEPQVLLLDEPCSALDPISTRRIEELIRQLKSRYTVLMVTHNLGQARRLADQVAVCWVQEGCGCVVECDSAETVFERSQNPITLAYCNGQVG